MSPCNIWRSQILVWKIWFEMGGRAIPIKRVAARFEQTEAQLRESFRHIVPLTFENLSWASLDLLIEMPTLTPRDLGLPVDGDVLDVADWFESQFRSGS